jgi:hypothetical protein
VKSAKIQSIGRPIHCHRSTDYAQSRNWVLDRPIGRPKHYPSVVRKTPAEPRSAVAVLRSTAPPGAVVRKDSGFQDVPGALNRSTGRLLAVDRFSSGRKGSPVSSHRSTGRPPSVDRCLPCRQKRPVCRQMGHLHNEVISSIKPQTLAMKPQGFDVIQPAI